MSNSIKQPKFTKGITYNGHKVLDVETSEEGNVYTVKAGESKMVLTETDLESLMPKDQLTGGKWTAKANPSDPDKIGIWADTDKQGLQLVGWAVSDFKHPYENEANARLMAASKDLAAALEGMLDVFNDDGANEATKERARLNAWEALIKAK